MNVDFVRPHTKDLIFQLYARPLHPELFEARAIRKIERDDYTVTLRITPMGHVITWDTEDVCLTEIATAMDQPLPEKRRLLRCKMRGETSRKVQCAHGVCYQMCFQIETMQPEVFLHTHDELIADGHKHACMQPTGWLLHNFQPNHRLAIAPLSLIAAETKKNCLLVSTFHTFPAENTVVKSQTLIEKEI